MIIEKIEDKVKGKNNKQIIYAGMIGETIGLNNLNYDKGLLLLTQKCNIFIDCDVIKCYE